MEIIQLFFKNKLRNFSYLLRFESGAIFCIDPFESDLILSQLNSNEFLKGIVNTHDHCDHYSGNDGLIQKFNCEVYAHQNAEVPHKKFGLKNDDIIFQNEEWILKAIDTPGHTLSHICIMLLKNKIPYAFFTGDCFFNAGVGNCYNGGDVKKLFMTIETIFSTLPDDLLIYPGHEYLKRNLEFTLSVNKKNNSAKIYLDKIKNVNLDEVFYVSNMKIEREINSFLQLDNSDIRDSLNLSTESRQEVFISLRELRNSW
jgi:hydroxyacylglutathione hydrolase